MHLNYTLEYMLNRRWFLGVNGYFLQQVSDAKLLGEPVANSKERVFAIGPGVLFVLDGNVSEVPTSFTSVVIGNLYFETLVRNRPQGIRLNLRLIKYFD